jgi:hypothetical protein
MSSYKTRMMRAGIGRHTMPQRPLPTNADFMAVIYDQEWAHFVRGEPPLHQFVLALSPAHAEKLGLMRLRQQYGGDKAKEIRLVQNTPRTHVTSDALGALLEIEGHDECADRQQVYLDMGFPGPTTR